MELPKKYEASAIEERWYSHWEESGYFHSEPDEREPFTIVIPPPNVTGVLHMGHMLNNTIQDLLIRKARMQGKNACWVPGTDHASIATEAKVVQMLADKGIDKNTLSRDEFMKHAWEWKEKYGGIILKQLKRIGASCDWNRTRFTMEDDLYSSVIKVFVDLYNKGLIYKGYRMVNWDPKAKTALSDEEVVYKEENSKLYYVKYPIVGSEEEFIVIATTRPETILGDTAICVHPEDERYFDLKGKKARVPLTGREVPIIEDEYVDPEFGTGALKITPAHDENDYNLGEKHNLEMINILDDSGILNDHALEFKGLDRFAGRKKVAAKLEEKELLLRIEDITNKVGYSERTHVVIEPRISEQWFLKMKELADPALQIVLEKELKIIPNKMVNTYRHWMENIKDWCISRQLWWGQRIPAYYLPDGQMVVAENEENALKKAVALSGDANLEISDLRQDEDVLDTWFSSWLWPISVFNGINEPENKEIKYYYPTNVLVTGQDIIFFWVARMIMAGLEYREVKPFHEVYFTGMVRDEQGRKMSKSLGNSPDIFELIDRYGADGTRFGVLISSPAGNDLLFDEKLCEQGRNFSNKIFNAMKLIRSWKEGRIGSVSDELKLRNSNASMLFEARFNAGLELIEKNYTDYRISTNLTNIYRLFWEDYCSKFLEWIKPGRNENIDQETYERAVSFFENLLKILHPFMPFVTEELWHLIKERVKGDDLIIASYPKVKSYNPELVNDFERLSELLSSVLNFKAKNNLKTSEAIEVRIRTSDKDFYNKYKENFVFPGSGCSGINLIEQPTEEYPSYVVGSDDLQPIVELSINKEEELDRITKELDYTEGFLKSVMKKLSNEAFVKNAKAEIVEREKQKKADAEAKIEKLRESLERLK